MNTQNAIVGLLKQIKFNKRQAYFAALCSILNKICDIVPEILIGLAIDTIANQENSMVASTGVTNPISQLYLIGALTALLWVLESVFEYLYLINWHELAQTIQHNLRLKSYAHVQNLDLAYFENKTTGELLAILQDDINQLEDFYSNGPNEIIQLGANIVIMGLIFLYLSPILALLTILPVPFVIIISYHFQHKLASLYQNVRETASNLTAHINYRLQGIAIIKSYVTQKYELEQLTDTSNLYLKANNQANHVNSKYIPIVRMAIMVGFIMALVVGGIYALQGKIPINWYAALVFLTQRFLWPFTSITTITAMYERALASAKRILNLLNSQATIIPGKQALSTNQVLGSVKFNQVTFGYKLNLPVIKNLNFEISPKQTVAFVGATGSGKSTLVKLLLRFYDLNTGTILIDNQDIKNLDLNSLRSAIGLVSQEVYLTEGTIAQNIAYGTFDADKNDIINAAKLAQAHDFIMELPQQYNTQIQEYGKNLSGGQRQRIAIARAIIKKAPILIFDEATSAIDNETESIIQQSLDILKKDHTIIIIAHRLLTVRNADIIFVLDHGQIIESGTHEQLLTKNGAYANLWKKQF